MECLRLEGCQAVLKYVHANWGQYAAAVRNAYGRGTAYYMGCRCSKVLLKKILKEALDSVGIKGNEGSDGFPLIVRKGTNQLGKKIVYLLNYSADARTACCPEGQYQELLSGKEYSQGESLCLSGWQFAILEGR